VSFNTTGPSSGKCGANDENDEDDLDLSNRLDNRRLGAPRAETTAVAAAALQNAQLGSPDVHEDAPVAEDDDDERQQHADQDVE